MNFVLEFHNEKEYQCHKSKPPIAIPSELHPRIRYDLWGVQTKEPQEQIYITKAKSFWEKSRQAEEALGQLEIALKINKNSIIAWIYKGEILIGLNRFEEALASYDFVLKINNTSFTAWMNKGAILSNEMDRPK